MEIHFASNRLATACVDDRSRTRAFGSDRAKKLKVRLSTLTAANCLDDLRNAPGRFHELSGNRTEQFAATLDGSYRLVFEPIIGDADRHHHERGYDWSRITVVRILSIEDYHG